MFLRIVKFVVLQGTCSEQFETFLNEGVSSKYRVFYILLLLKLYIESDNIFGTSCSLVSLSKNNKRPLGLSTSTLSDTLG